MAAKKNFTFLNNPDNWHAPPGMSMTDYVVGRKIGSGSSCHVRLARKKSDGVIYSVKLERSNNFSKEYTAYVQLGSVPPQMEYPTHIPRVYHFTKCGEYSALVMDLMGLSLHDLLFHCNGSFSLKTVLQIAKQMLHCVEYVHSKNMIHKDIKPANFVIGRRSEGTENVIYLIDFGLSTDYMDVVSKEHVPFADNYVRRGTLEFMSLNAYKKYRPSRRDDLESVLYTLMYLLKGYLPMIGSSIAQMKEQSEMTICKDFPSEFANCLTYVRGLGFSETPSYQFLQNEFQMLFNQKNYVDDSVFDWTGKYLPEIDESYEQRLSSQK